MSENYGNPYNPISFSKGQFGIVVISKGNTVALVASVATSGGRK